MSWLSRLYCLTSWTSAFLQVDSGEQRQPLSGELAEEVARRVHAEACLVEMRQFNTAVLEQAQVSADKCHSHRLVAA